MTEQTKKFLKINNHIIHNGGMKSVCVTTCLSFFGIPIESYNYTSSNKNVYNYIDVLRRFGYSVRSKKSEFKALNYPTMSELRTNIRKSKYTEKDFFIVSCIQSKKAHLVVIDGKGNIIIDTAPNMKWKVRLVSIVERV